MRTDRLDRDVRSSYHPIEQDSMTILQTKGLFAERHLVYFFCTKGRFLKLTTTTKQVFLLRVWVTEFVRVLTHMHLFAPK